MSTEDTTEPLSGRRFERLDPRLLAVLVALGLLFVAIVGQSLLTAVIGAAILSAVGLTLADPTALVVIVVVNQLALIGIGAVYLTRRLDGLPFRKPSKNGVQWLAGGLAMTFVVYGLQALIYSATELENPPDALARAGAAEPWVFLAMAVVAIALVGPGEELFYRGAIQGRLRRAFGPTGAIALASLLFAAVHVPNYLLGNVSLLAPGVPFNLGLIVVIGAIIGAVYEYTENLLIPILVHGLYDAIILVGVYSGIAPFL
jgi:hypothetical protein